MKRRVNPSSTAGSELTCTSPCATKVSATARAASAGAEAILQLRSASLCEDGRLDDYLRRRLGCPITRRPTLGSAA